MALTDSMMKLVTRSPKGAAPAEDDRSSREIKVKNRAGVVVNIFAGLLAVNAWYSGSLNSQILNDTIRVNDLWSFYQAKSIKQTQYQLASEQVADPAKREAWARKAASYESDPVGQEGKREIMAQARAVEAQRDLAKRKAPWIGFASTAYQISIVLLSASILSVSMPLFWASVVVSGIGLALTTQGVWLWMSM